VRCGTRVVGPEDVLGPRVSPGGSKGDTPGSVMAGRVHGSESSGVCGPCLEQVRASERLERDVRVAGPVRVGARGVGTRRSGVSTGRTWPRPTAGTMDRIAAVTVDGTPFESN